MANRVYGYQGYKGYQFETSPKKLKPEYEPQDSELKKKLDKSSNNRKMQKKQESKPVTQNKKMSKEEINNKIKLVCYIVFGFSMLFTISYRNSIINEKFNEKENLKQELAEIQKINEQLEVGIENELNLTNIEALAKEKLGMSKLSNEQKVYISLPKKEYIESTSEGILERENQNLYQKVVKAVKNFFNIN